MDDLISRQDALNGILSFMPYEPKKDASSAELVNYIAWKCAVNCAESIVRTMPPARPERKKGYWQITDAYPHNVYCSECHTKFAQTHWAVWEDGSLPRKFCPNCGCEMEGEDDE